MVKSSLFPSIPDVDQLFLKLKKWRTSHRISKDLRILCLCPHNVKPKLNFLTDAIPVENGEEHEGWVTHMACVPTAKFQSNFFYRFPYIPEEQGTIPIPTDVWIGMYKGRLLGELATDYTLCV